MADIRLLPSDLVHKIAAGEVIERPASVVKELVENALDAGATRITVTVADGGRQLSVSDNGTGMTPDNVQKAFTNHATSKLPTDDALFAIASLGFRGEALASISAIARVTCETRTVDAIDGSRLVLVPGEPLVQVPTGCAVGTRMAINDLFYTTPARLKFLKKPQTEVAHIQELLENLALSHPDVRFVLTLDDKTTLDTNGSGQLADVANHIYGATDWLTVHRADDAMQVTGLVTAPTIQKSTKRWLTLLVNGRYVRCPVLTRAVESAYEQILPPKRYPMAIINLSLPYTHVDVNVHPSKREVRYADGQAVFGLTRAAIQQALDTRGFWQQAGFTAVSSSAQPTTAAHPNPSTRLTSYFSSAKPSINPVNQPWQAIEPLYRPLTSDRDATVEQALPLEDQATTKPAFRVIGQLYLTYMLVETQQGLMVVDQHIASERVWFEQLSRQLMEAPAQSLQALLLPVQRTLRPTQAERLHGLLPDLLALGITATITNLQLSITTIPALLQDRLPTGWVDDMLNRLDTTDSAPQLPIHDVVATLACHAAVRAGDALTHQAMETVMTQWLACTLPWSCPHGRPIAHTIPTGDLNAFFERPGLPAMAMHQLA
jgi:DNA mismatch repair protein MutL